MLLLLETFGCNRGHYLGIAERVWLRQVGWLFNKLLWCYSCFSLVVYEKASFCFVIIEAMLFSEVVRLCDIYHYLLLYINIIFFLTKKVSNRNIFWTSLILLELLHMHSVGKFYLDHNFTSWEVSVIFDMVRIQFE